MKENNRVKSYVSPYNSFENVLFRCFLLVFLLIAILFQIHNYSAHQREVILHNAEYAGMEIVDNVAVEIAATIGYAKSSINVVALSISERNDLEVMNNPRKVIEPFIENTPFGTIEYIRPDGMNMMNIGDPFDASDREYYIEGMKGNSGIWNNYAPKYSKETLVNFYTPLMVDDEICGVITGYIPATQDLKPLLMTNFFGEKVIVLIYEDNGKLICSSEDAEFIPNKTLNQMFDGYGLDDAQKENLIGILQGGECDDVAFTSIDGEGRAFVEPIEGTNWSIAVIIPPTSFAAVTKDSTESALKAIVGVCVFVGVFVLINFFFYVRERRKINVRNISLEEENKKYDDENKRALEELKQAYFSLEEKQGKLEDALAQADAANQAKSTFLFNMSHDIRTPMNAIIGFRDLLEKHQDDPVKRQNYLDKMKSSNEVLLSIINNVLEMARIEQGTILVEENVGSAEQFIDSMYSMFKEMMDEKRIKFEKVLDVEHNFIHYDLGKIRDIYVNLISNAYKYTNPGGTVTLSLRELPCEQEGYARYQTSVSDTGIGMAEDFVPHIFEEFSRENNTTDARIEGTGLGMPIVKRLVDLLGGKVEVKSTKDVGTTFIITMDHKIADPAEFLEGSEQPKNSDWINVKRILLTEDNDINAEIATELLNESGFIVERAEDGVVCINKLTEAEAGYYDIILMDIQMPNMNGYETTEEIRKMSDAKKASIPIVAMTANAFEEDRRMAFRSGMDGHLSKPFKMKNVLKELSRLLNS